MSEEIKKAISEKIDSAEKWSAITDEYTITRPDALIGGGSGVDWWYTREKARLQYGIYEMTAINRIINDHMPWACTHISAIDKCKIAYTPDVASGRADRQLAMSPGKLITRLFPHLRDEHVQKLVADYLAEVNTEIIYLTELEDILKVYSDRGIGACMSKGADSFATGGILPASVYAGVEGLALAVVYNEAGGFAARSLVRPDKKIYIRCYGDERLKSALVRHGYKPGTLHGLRFPAIPVKGGHNQWVMPYLDGNGAAGSSERSYVAHIDGMIESVTMDQVKNIQGILGSSRAACSTLTSGSIQLIPFQRKDIQYVDAITGETVETPPKCNVVIRVENGVAVMGKTALDRYGLESRGYCRVSDGNGNAVWHLDAPTFEYGYTTYIESIETRKQLGFYKLSSFFYGAGGSSEWQIGRRKVCLTESNHHILMSDAVTILRNDGYGSISSVFWHESEVIPEDFIRVHGSNKTYAEPGIAVIKTDGSKKAVVKGYHSLTDLWNGGVELSSSRSLHWAYEHTSNGMAYVGELPPELQKGSDFLVARFEASIWSALVGREYRSHQDYDLSRKLVVIVDDFMNVSVRHMDLPYVTYLRDTSYLGLTSGAWNAMNEAGAMTPWLLHNLGRNSPSLVKYVEAFKRVVYAQYPWVPKTPVQLVSLGFDDGYQVEWGGVETTTALEETAEPIQLPAGPIPVLPVPLPF